MPADFSGHRVREIARRLNTRRDGGLIAPAARIWLIGLASKGRLDDMTAVRQIELVSIDEYLAGELATDIRHEYLGGYVYAMAGATNVHNRVASNWMIAVGRRLPRGGPCRIFNPDTKVRVRFTSHTRFYYPDGMVVCEPNPGSDTFQDKPIVIAEVISEATRRTDEGEKREAYLTLSTLSAYMVIETNRPRVVVHRRAGAGEFAPELYDGLDAVISLRSLGADLPLAELYDGVDFASAHDPPPEATSP